MVEAYQAKLGPVTRGSAGRPLPVETSLPPYAPARVRLAEALYLAAAAQEEKDPIRGAHILVRADAYLRDIDDVRPHWGQLWIAHAYVRSLASPRFSRQEKEALVRSYLDAPYLYDAGRWRVMRAMANWTALPTFTRDRAARETVWLYRVSSGGDPTQFLDAARGSDAYLPVFLELARPTE